MSTIDSTNRGGAHEPAGPSGGSQPAQRPRRRRGLIVGIVVAAVVVALLATAGIVGANIAGSAYAPENAVRAYLQALQNGNAEEALELTGTDAGQDDVLLTDDAYASADARISGFSLGEPTIDGDVATIVATIQQGDQEYEQEFSLTKSGRQALLFDTWALDAPELGVVRATVDAPDGIAATVAGVVLDGRAELELRAFPGTYEIALAESEWFAAEPQSATVVGFGADASAAQASLTVELTDAGERSAVDAVNAYLDDCIAQDSIAPDGCPFEAGVGGAEGFEISNVVWTLDDRPTVTLGAFRNGSWPVSTDDAGSASMVCDIRNPATGVTGRANAGPATVRVGGSITGFDQDGAVFEP